MHSQFHSLDYGTMREVEPNSEPNVRDSVTHIVYSVIEVELQSKNLNEVFISYQKH